MSFLVTGVFNDEFRAQQAMSELIRVHKPRRDLDNALLITWNGNDPIAQQSQNLADRTGAGWGVLWGCLLGSVIESSGEIGAAVASLRGRAIGSGIGSSSDPWRSGIEIPTDFFRDVAALVTPGRSAIFFVSHSATVESAARVTHGYGGTLLSVKLTATQLGKLRAFIKAHGSN